jgi:pimeloyl-ACP methyl ester carboxylesterase
MSLVSVAHVAGTPWGTIGIELALHHPDRVKSLMLLGSCGKTDARRRAVIESRVATGAGGSETRSEPALIYTSGFGQTPERLIASSDTY